MSRPDLIKYIRTDKNGTKIYHDYTCPRCAGMGEADNWINTGKVCFACGGSGIRVRPLVVKEYTDEYWTKLQARRQAKAEKYAEEHAEEIAAEKAERERKEAEWRKETFMRDCEKFGCGADGVGYVLKGNTYRVKDQIKAAGGKWVAQIWVCPVKINANGVSAIRIDLNDCINEYGNVSYTDAQDIIFCIGQRGESYEEAKETVADWNK